MNNVPNMISTKDLSYLEDIFNWNVTASKKAFHFSKEVKDSEIHTIIESCATLHSNICKDVLQILKGGFYE